MQHPVGYSLGKDGVLHLADFWTFLFNPWAFWQYAHNMLASVVTASFVLRRWGRTGRYCGTHAEHATICLRVGAIAGLLSCLLVAFPAGDGQGKLLAKYQPAALAAMEGSLRRAVPTRSSP